MTLFDLGKKKEEKETSACTCSCSADGEEKPAIDPDPGANGGACRVKVLGSGCRSCHELYENAKKAVENMGLSTEVEYVTDMRKIMEFGVMSMPALVVDEKVASMGRVLKTVDIVALLGKMGL